MVSKSISNRNPYLSSGSETLTMGKNDTIVIYTIPDQHKIQFYVSGEFESGARIMADGVFYSKDSYAWYTMREQEINDLITLLEYAKLKITKGEDPNGE